MLRLFLPFLIVSLSKAEDASTEEAKDELSRHFSVDNAAIQEVGSLLDKLKRLAHQDYFGPRGGHDFDVDAEKEKKMTKKVPLAPYLFEGDIFLNQKQATALIAQFERKRSTRSLSSEDGALWEKQPITYRFHDSLEFFTIQKIIAAIEYWESNTCLTFKHVDEVESGDYIEFFKGQGCYSMIGRYGGRQGVSIGAGCERPGVIQHEIGHALGLWHEQSRPDASEFIEVENDFILPTYMSDFQQRGNDEITTLGIPYDYGSVMHYGPTAFSIDGKSFTLVTKDKLYQHTIGQREKLAFYDIAIINRAYCHDRCSSLNVKNRCANGGYPHPQQCEKCICPEGFGGKYCKEQEQSQNSDCGGVIKVEEKWIYAESPGYSAQEDYGENQKCSWIFKAPKDMQIEAEFVEEFGLFCSTVCLDYVELKLATDKRRTGARFCCYNKPEQTFISEGQQLIVVFRSQISTDIGFKLKLRATNKKPNGKSESATTTTEVPTTVKGVDVWSEWDSWSKCSRSCGGCGIRSRTRTCQSTTCSGRNQEFSTCNMNACPVAKGCESSLLLHKMCDASNPVCGGLASKVNDCHAATCCPPFVAVNGICQNSDKEAIQFGK